MSVTRQQTFADFSSLVGVPYEKSNCWETARDFYALVFGIELKHYCDQAPESRTDIQNLIFSNIGDFVEVKEMQFGDLLLIRLRGIESHIGIFVGGGKFLHSAKGTGSAIDRLEKWKHLIVGIYRHRSDT